MGLDLPGLVNTPQEIPFLKRFRSSSPVILRFNELYAKAGGPKGHLVDREAFSKYFNLPVAVGDRLFDAFDKQQVNEL